MHEGAVAQVVQDQGKLLRVLGLKAVETSPAWLDLLLLLVSVYGGDEHIRTVPGELGGSQQQPWRAI